MKYAPALAILGFIAFGIGAISYKIGEQIGSERIFAEWRASQEDVQSKMRKLGFCEWSEQFRKLNRCPVP